MNSKNSSKLAVLALVLTFAIGAVVSQIPQDAQASWRDDLRNNILAQIGLARGGDGGAGGSGGDGGITVAGDGGNGGNGGAGGSADDNTIAQSNSCGENNDSPNSGEQEAECVDQDAEIDQDIDQDIDQSQEQSCGTNEDQSAGLGFINANDCVDADQNAEAENEGGDAEIDCELTISSCDNSLNANNGDSSNTNSATGGDATGDPSASNEAEVEQDQDQEANQDADQDADIDQDADVDQSNEATQNNIGGNGGNGGAGGAGGDSGDANGGDGGEGGNGGDADVDNQVGDRE